MAGIYKGVEPDPEKARKRWQQLTERFLSKYKTDPVKDEMKANVDNLLYWTPKKELKTTEF